MNDSRSEHSSVVKQGESDEVEGNVYINQLVETGSNWNSPTNNVSVNPNSCSTPLLTQVDQLPINQSLKTTKFRAAVLIITGFLIVTCLDLASVASVFSSNTNSTSNQYL